MSLVMNILESGWRLLEQLGEGSGEEKAVLEDEKRLANEMRKTQLEKLSGRTEGFYSTDIGEQTQGTYEAARQRQAAREASQGADVGQDMYALTRAAKTRAFGDQ